jgi:hypothetical protein
MLRVVRARVMLLGAGHAENCGLAVWSASAAQQQQVRWPRTHGICKQVAGNLVVPTSSMLLLTAELPMLALTLVRK